LDPAQATGTTFQRDFTLDSTMVPLITVKCCATKRYAIENYFSLEVLKDIFGPQIPDSVTKITPGRKLETQIGLNVKKNNKKIAQRMTLDDIRDTDLYKFFERVGEILHGSEKVS
jgi:hypothetical protein